jgi:hypothetical protein
VRVVDTGVGVFTWDSARLASEFTEMLLRIFN